VTVLLGLSLLLVQYIVDELPFVLNVVAGNLPIEPGKKRFAFLVEVPAGTIPGRLCERASSG